MMTHQRDRIHIGSRDAGDQVGGAGAGGDNADAGLAGHPGVAVGGVAGVLFGPHEDVPDIGPGQGVIKGADGRPRIAKDLFDPLCLETSDHRLRHRHDHQQHLPEIACR